MRVLLIAYEFSPSPSPQSLRWNYLTRELQLQGHEVHVLAPDVAAWSKPLESFPGVVVHRTAPGPVRGLLSWIARRKRKAPPGGTIASDRNDIGGRPAADARLNWKGRTVERVQSILEQVVFPDLRGEWKQPAKRALKRLLPVLKPDVVISSHEPATTLELGLIAKRTGYRWVADLGDPVLAAYTPARWRRRAWRLERRVCREADAIVVTTEATRRLLVQRHGVEDGKVKRLTQGFDDRSHLPEGEAVPDGAAVRLLYTGSFYAFRDPVALLEAVVRVSGIRLEIATSKAPVLVQEYARRHPDKVVILGFLGHLEARIAQKRADVLVNIGNDDSTQVPGKLFEYMGARRPILHIGGNADRDEGAQLIRALRLGWVCQSEEQIRGLLENIVRDPSQLDSPSMERVGAYGWSVLGGTLCQLLTGVVDRGNGALSGLADESIGC